MEFLKTHYEKIVLSVVLLGLAAAAAFMPMRISKEEELANERKTTLFEPKVKPLEPIDLTTNAAAIIRLEKPSRLQLAGDHNVFNPVRWQKRPDGGVIKGTDAGINALQVTNISPLRFRVAYDEPTGEPGNQGYTISVLNEAQSSRPTPRVGRLKQKNNMFTIQEVRGEPSSPTELSLVLEGEKEPIVISKEKPFERVVGFSADFRYEPENRTWKKQKKDDEISFGGETYKVVAITPTEVVLSAKSNKKQTVKEYHRQQK